ncbi:hypothetical protein SISSUDRAFT_1065837 [Sistotremastrum suecicum HHB10207 ss-3]|uniref:MYND-type domain-containing protein n=1 Tax=Sistotremastrum suecicum HHB10207 ss-3 TaxID=1314776 RepID=A0A165Z0K6_9AGAM|nr:hypothetical protein SISSUDRAFT_1065837 [Sistotremastrum suecicum HHB10207 ss-3]
MSSKYVKCRCDNCFQVLDRIRVCDGCSLAQYCDKMCLLTDWPAHRTACRAIQRWASTRSPPVVRYHFQIYRWISCGAVLWEWAAFQALRGHSPMEYLVHVRLERSQERKEAHLRFKIGSIECVPMESSVSPLRHVMFGAEELSQQETKRHQFFVGNAASAKIVFEAEGMFQLCPVSLYDHRCNRFALKDDDQWLVDVKRSFDLIWANDEAQLLEFVQLAAHMDIRV